MIIFHIVGTNQVSCRSIDNPFPIPFPIPISSSKESIAPVYLCPCVGSQPLSQLALTAIPKELAPNEEKGELSFGPYQISHYRVAPGSEACLGFDASFARDVIDLEMSR
jgi:hypothetical protein